MQVELGTLLGYVFGIIGVLIGVAGWMNNRDKDKARSAESTAEIKVMLTDTRSGIGDIKQSMKEMGCEVKDLNGRVIAVEESTKSAHKRIDEHLQKEV